MGKLVGLIGLRGAGKDTVAKFLVEEGWTRTAFADALYQEVANAFGVTVEFLGNRDTKETPLPELALSHCSDLAFVEVVLSVESASVDFTQPGVKTMALTKPRSPRQILQYWGTEYRRNTCREDYWRAQIQAYVTARPEEDFVVTDVRFPDEADLVKALGGSLARVVRPGLGGSSDPALQHASEQAMLNYQVPTVFENAEGPIGLDKLRAAVLAKFGSPVTA